MTAVPDLIASCWTSGGNTAPLWEPDTSPIDIRTRIETAARTGWQGIGIWHNDLIEIRQDLGLEEVARILRDNGLDHVELEFIGDWWTTGEQRTQADLLRREMLDAAPILGARHIKAGCGLDPTLLSVQDITDPGPDKDLLAEEFDRLANDAAAAGVKIALEPSPFSHLPTLQSAVDLVTTVGNRNGGLMLDIWHIHRAGTGFDDIARITPPEYVFGIEIDDGRTDLVGTLWEDTINSRVFPGDGDFDVPAFINAVAALNFTGPWGVEIISDQLRGMPLEAGLRGVHDAVLRSFAAADRLAAARI